MNTDSSPGVLVPIAEGTAFLPDPVPPEISVSWGLLRSVEAAHGAVSELAGQARLIENIGMVIRALGRREAVLSSRMEGTNTNIVEVLGHEAGGGGTLTEDSDLHEVINYVKTVELATQWLADGRVLGIPLVTDLHRRLLLGVRGDDKAPGRFRRHNVYIGRASAGFAGARFVPPPPEHVPALMDNLMAFITEDHRYGPLVSAALAHYQFETIHPFEDGNGRLGRLLIPIQLLHHGVIDRPVLYMAAALERQDERYRDLLLDVSQHGRWVEWITFFIDAIRESAEDARRRVNGLMGLLGHYRERARSGSTSRYAIPAIDVVFRNVIVNAPLIAQQTRASDPTARAVIADLVAMGILRRYQRIGNSQSWVAEEVLDCLYGD